VQRALLLIALAACSKKQAELQFVDVKRDDLVFGVEVSGELAAVDSTDIHPLNIGEIWDFKIVNLASDGDDVKVGAPVVAFDPSNVMRALENMQNEAEAAQKSPEKKRDDAALARRDDELKVATVSDSSSTTTTGELVFVIPLVGTTTSNTHSVKVVNSHQKTILLDGARFEDLTLADRQQLTDAAKAGSVLTTRITVGANYSNWWVAQNVEVMLKLASPTTGKMLWSTRCEASSEQFASVDQAVENAARCAVGALTGP